MGVSDTLHPVVVQIFFFSLVPIKPADEKPHRLSKLEQSQFSLTEDLKAILVGLALGDLFIKKQSVNARLEIKQGTIHKEYLLHLYELFKFYCSSAPKLQIGAPDKRTGKVYSFIRFTTYSLPCFNEFLDLF